MAQRYRCHDSRTISNCRVVIIQGNNLSPVKMTLENVDSFSEDSEEEDGDWNNVITVDCETAKNKENLFLLLRELPRIPRNSSM